MRKITLLCVLLVGFLALQVAAFAADNGRVKVLGAGATPTLSCSPASLSFPDTEEGATTALPITVTGTGLTEQIKVTITTDGDALAFFMANTFLQDAVLPADGGVLQIAFNSYDAGTFTGEVVLESGSVKTRVLLSGRAVPPMPKIKIDDESLIFENTAVGETPQMWLNGSIVNGTDEMTSVTAVLSGTNANLFSVPVNAIEIEWGSFTIPVTFKPVAAGSFSARLTVKCGELVREISLVATATGGSSSPIITINPESVNFSTVVTGLTKEVELSGTIENITNASQSLNATISGADAALFTIPDNEIVLGLGASFSIPVTFKPTTVGTFGATLTLKYGALTKEVVLTGVGESGGSVPPSLEVSKTEVTIGPIAPGKSRMSIVQGKRLNTTDPIVLTLGGSDKALFSVPGNIDVAEDGSFNFTVAFRPTEVGEFNAKLTIACGALKKEVNITGKCELPVTVTLSTESLTFGDIKIGKTAEKVVSIDIRGFNDNVRVEVVGEGFATIPAETELPPEGGDVMIGFKPTVVGKTYEGTLKFILGTMIKEVALSGKGIPAGGEASIVCTPAALNFPETTLLTSQLLELTVVGNNLSESISATIEGDMTPFLFGSFEKTQTLPATGGKLEVVFTAPTVGDHSAKIKLTSGGVTTDVLMVAKVSGNTPADPVLEVNKTEVVIGPIAPGKSRMSIVQGKRLNTTNPIVLTLSGADAGLFAVPKEVDVAEDGNFNFTVAFRPVEGGEFSAKLLISCGSLTKEVSILGKCEAPVSITTSAESLSFGEVEINKTSEKSLSFTITGASPAPDGIEISVSGDGFSQGVSTSSSEITVKFAPTVKDKEYVGALIITVGTVVKSIPLTGKGMDYTAISETQTRGNAVRVVSGRIVVEVGTPVSVKIFALNGIQIFEGLVVDTLSRSAAAGAYVVVIGDNTFKVIL